MKSVLISIKPRWCELIASGKKTVEVRKTRPKIDVPFKGYIYCTKEELLTRSHYNGKIYVASSRKCQTALERNGNITFSGKVIGEFVCDKIDRIQKRGIHNNFDYCYLSLNEWGNDDIEIEITDIKKSCISKEELNLYGAHSPCLFAWHISNFVIYDKPRELSEFRSYNTRAYFDEKIGLPMPTHEITRPPQSWLYVESEVDTE